VINKPLEVLQEVQEFEIGQNYNIICPTNISFNENPKFQWFLNQKPILNLSNNYEIVRNRLILMNAQFILNGKYFSCRSYFKYDNYVEYIWPIRVISDTVSSFYTKINAPLRLVKKEGDYLRLICYAVNKAHYQKANQIRNLSFVWRRMDFSTGNNIVQSESNKLMFKLHKDDSGIYACTAENRSRNMTSTVFTVINVIN
jgi:hypothetical protein